MKYSKTIALYLTETAEELIQNIQQKIEDVLVEAYEKEHFLCPERVRIREILQQALDHAKDLDRKRKE